MPERTPRSGVVLGFGLKKESNFSQLKILNKIEKPYFEVS